jgi:hypothetical protein
VLSSAKTFDGSSHAVFQPSIRDVNRRGCFVHSSSPTNAAPTAKMVPVWPTPQNAPIRDARAVALIADDGCDRNDVVGVRGVAHPQEKSHREDGEKGDHAFQLSCLN